MLRTKRPPRSQLWSYCCKRVRHSLPLLRLPHLPTPPLGAPPRPLQAELSRERATVLVVDQGGGPVGWAVSWEVPFELHLMSVAVHPAHRRRGLARRLLTALFEHHRCRLTVACLPCLCPA